MGGGVLSAVVGSGGDVSMSLKLIWAAVVWVEGHNSTQGGTDIGRLVYIRHPCPPEKDLGKGRVVIECSLCCVITGCRVIFQKWHWCAGVRLTSLSELWFWIMDKKDLRSCSTFMRLACQQWRPLLHSDFLQQFIDLSKCSQSFSLSNLESHTNAFLCLDLPGFRTLPRAFFKSVLTQW